MSDKVKFYRSTENQILNRPIENGALYFATDTPKIYMDDNNIRTCYASLTDADRRVNKNLLDNWYFIGGGSQQGGGQFPINQRGLTEYTGRGYSIDRWRISPDMSLTLSSNFITLTKGNVQSSFRFIQQIFEPGLTNSLQGKQVTFSILCKGTSNHVHIGLYDETSFYGDATFQTPADIGLLTITTVLPDAFSNGSVLIYPDYDNGANGVLDLFAAKLELGPNQTLAHQDADGNWVLNDPAPNFTDELMRCARYQQFLGGTGYARFGIGYAGSTSHAYLDIPLLAPLRATPTVSLIGRIQLYRIATATQVPIKAIAHNNLTQTLLTVRVDTEPDLLVKGEVVLIQATNNATARLLIDSNLY